MEGAPSAGGVAGLEGYDVVALTNLGKSGSVCEASRNLEAPILFSRSDDEEADLLVCAGESDVIGESESSLSGRSLGKIRLEDDGKLVLLKPLAAPVPSAKFAGRPKKKPA